MTEGGSDDDFAAERRDGRIAETVSFQLLVAVNRLTRPFHERHGRHAAVTLTEWRCMMALAARPGQSGEDVALLMGLDRMTVSRTLRRLEARGAAARASDPQNRRRNRWRLLPAGWRVVDAVLPEALRRDRELFGDLSAEERAVLARVLRRIAP